MKKKILFIQPTVYDDRGEVIKKDILYFVGLSYPLLAAMTPDDWEVEICLETIEDVPFDTDASVVGIGGMGHAANRGKDLAIEFRKRGKTVIMGGPMASLVPDVVLEFCDAVVIGDAENVWSDVIRDLEHGTLQRKYHKPLQDLKTPPPRYELILNKKIGDFLPVQAGRGCPNVCSFCSIYCLYRTRYLKREIADVMRDILRVKSLGFKKFLLLDDNIISEPDYARALFQEIRKAGMRWMTQCSIDIARDSELLALAAESGCETLSFGLESINPESLKAINKSWAKPDEYIELIDRIADAGIDVATEMIVGIETDTRESLLSTIDFVKRSRIIAPKFYIMTPIPGTDLYFKMKEEGRIVDSDIFRYSPSRAVISHPNLTTGELNTMYWTIYDELYRIPVLLRRTVLHQRFFRAPGRYLFMLGLNLFYRYQIGKRIAPIIM
jgi:radical SAM superfamily enzyme YgiQ (UPF0313 family)